MTTTTNNNPLPPPRKPKGKRPVIGPTMTDTITVRFKEHKQVLDKLKAYAIKENKAMNLAAIELLDKALSE